MICQLAKKIDGLCDACIHNEEHEENSQCQTETGYCPKCIDKKP